LEGEWIKLFKAIEEKGSDMPFESTKRDIEIFKESRAWIDISSQLMCLLIAARDDLEQLGEGYDRNAISYLQGQCYILRCILSMPDTIINSLKKEGEEDEPQHEES